MVAILACAAAAVDGPLARTCIVPGEIVWDDCGCGQLALSENRRFPALVFPLEEIDHQAECGSPYLVVDLTLSLTRCTPVGQNGNPPTCDALRDAAMQMSKDKADLRAALVCCLEDMYNQNSTNGLQAYEVLAQESVGPQGACVGVETHILIGFLNPCGC